MFNKPFKNTSVKENERYFKDETGRWYRARWVDGRWTLSYHDKELGFVMDSKRASCKEIYEGVMT